MEFAEAGERGRPGFLSKIFGRPPRGISQKVKIDYSSLTGKSAIPNVFIARGRARKVCGVVKEQSKGNTGVPRS